MLAMLKRNEASFVSMPETSCRRLGCHSSGIRGLGRLVTLSLFHQCVSHSLFLADHGEQGHWVGDIER